MATFRMYHCTAGSSDKLWGYHVAGGTTYTAHGRRGSNLVVEPVQQHGPEMARKKEADGYRYAGEQDFALPGQQQAATPQSSNLQEWKYHAGAKKLFVTFKSGDAYEYSGVPQTEIDALNAASSKGSYFNANIKNRYTTSKLAADTTVDAEMERLNDVAFLFMTAKAKANITSQVISRYALPLARTVKDGPNGGVHVTFRTGKLLAVKLNGGQWSATVSDAHSTEARLTLLAIAKAIGGKVTDDANQTVAYGTLKEVEKAIRSTHDNLEDLAVKADLVKATFKFSSLKATEVMW